MTPKQYFEDTRGFGVLSTADDQGHVDAAVYSRPHVMEDGTLAFIMRDRLTHRNTLSNPHAIFLFREDAPGYKGRRFILSKTGEEEDPALIEKLRRRSRAAQTSAGERCFLVYFKIDKELPLVGSGEK